MEALRLAKVARELHLDEHVFVQLKATRARLGEAFQNAAVLDLSCHGKIDTDNFLQSHLQLADGRFTLADMLSQEEQVHGLRLLILSPARTAIPEVRGAVEEARNLPGCYAPGRRACRHSHTLAR